MGRIWLTTGLLTIFSVLAGYFFASNNREFAILLGIGGIVPSFMLIVIYTQELKEAVLKTAQNK